MTSIRSVKFTPEMKAVMELLISEILQCKTLAEIREITDSWVSANDLHPGRVREYQPRDAKMWPIDKDKGSC